MEFAIACFVVGAIVGAAGQAFYKQLMELFNSPTVTPVPEPVVAPKKAAPKPKTTRAKKTPTT